MKKEYQATNYESDLTDKQWEAIKEFFPSGNKSKYHKRSLVEAVLYIVKTGCQWRMLPHDYPPHDTVWSFYRRARENGVWDKMKLSITLDTFPTRIMKRSVRRQPLRRIFAALQQEEAHQSPSRSCGCSSNS